MSTSQGVTIFAIGALTGYSSRKVLSWLDEQAHRVFKISEKSATKVPNLQNESLNTAVAMLKACGLAVGKIKSVSSELKQGKVTWQEPPAESLVARGETVDVEIAEIDVQSAD